MFICIKQGFFSLFIFVFVCPFEIGQNFSFLTGKSLCFGSSLHRTFLWRKLIGCEIVWSFKQPKLVCIAFRLRNDLSYFLTWPFLYIAILNTTNVRVFVNAPVQREDCPNFQQYECGKRNSEYCINGFCWMHYAVERHRTFFEKKLMFIGHEIFLL